MNATAKSIEPVRDEDTVEVTPVLEVTNASRHAMPIALSHALSHPLAPLSLRCYTSSLHTHALCYTPCFQVGDKINATWMVGKEDQVTKGNVKYIGSIFPGIISSVDIAAEMYGIAYDDGCTEADVPFKGRVTVRTTLTAKEKTRATRAAKKEKERLPAELEAAALSLQHHREAASPGPAAGRSTGRHSLAKWALKTPSPGPDPPDSLGSASF